MRRLKQENEMLMSLIKDKISLLEEENRDIRERLRKLENPPQFNHGDTVEYITPTGKESGSGIVIDMDLETDWNDGTLYWDYTILVGDRKKFIREDNLKLKK